MVRKGSSVRVRCWAWIRGPAVAGLLLDAAPGAVPQARRASPGGVDRSRVAHSPAGEPLRKGPPGRGGVCAGVRGWCPSPRLARHRLTEWASFSLSLGLIAYLKLIALRRVATQARSSVS